MQETNKLRGGNNDRHEEETGEDVGVIRIHCMNVQCSKNKS